LPGAAEEEALVAVSEVRLLKEEEEGEEDVELDRKDEKEDPRWRNETHVRNPLRTLER
jgi:hypothetical protein